jgi:hypothetical protein
VVHVQALNFFFMQLEIAQTVMTREPGMIRSAKVTAVAIVVCLFASVSLAVLGFKHMHMAWAVWAELWPLARSTA